jgi:hypothetical protein
MWAKTTTSTPSKENSLRESRHEVGLRTLGAAAEKLLRGSFTGKIEELAVQLGKPSIFVLGGSWQQ